MLLSPPPPAPTIRRLRFETGGPVPPTENAPFSAGPEAQVEQPQKDTQKVQKSDQSDKPFSTAPEVQIEPKKEEKPFSTAPEAHVEGSPQAQQSQLAQQSSDQILKDNLGNNKLSSSVVANALATSLNREYEARHTSPGLDVTQFASIRTPLEQLAQDPAKLQKWIEDQRTQQSRTTALEAQEPRVGPSAVEQPQAQQPQPAQAQAQVQAEPPKPLPILPSPAHLEEEAQQPVQQAATAPVAKAEQPAVPAVPAVQPPAEKPTRPQPQEEQKAAEPAKPSAQATRPSIDQISSAEKPPPELQISAQQQKQNAAAGPRNVPRSVIATEFGWVDRAAVAAHPEKYPSGNKGFPDFGTVDLSGDNQKGVAIPAEDLQAHFGKQNFYQDQNGAWHASPQLARAIRNGDIMAEVTNPANGRKAMAPIVDVGPGKATGAGLDVLHGTALDLGFTSGKANMTLRIAGGSPQLSPAALAPTNLAEAAIQNTGHLNTTQDPGTNHGELACADAVTRIVRNQLGIDLTRTLSTATLHDNLEAGVQRGEWKKVPLNTPGAVIVSPTRGPMHGHTGIVGTDGKIYSNSSSTGNWGPNYTPESWQRRFGDNAYAYVPTDKVGHVPPGEYAVEEGGDRLGGFPAQAWTSVPYEGGGPSQPAPIPSAPSAGGGGTEEPLPSRPQAQSSIELPGGLGHLLPTAAMAAGLSRLFGGGERPRPTGSVEPEIEPPATTEALQARLERPERPPIDIEAKTIAPPAPRPALPAPSGPPPAPSGGGVAGAQAGLADAIKALQALGIKKKEAQAMLKGVQGKTTAELVQNALKTRQKAKGGAVPKPRPAPPAPTQPQGQLPGPPAAPAAPTPAQATQGPAASGAQPASPTPEERRAQIAGATEQAIAEKRPMHISYISAPKEAARYPTRESRTIQYDEHSREARLMGSTTGQLVGHSLIPVESRVTKEGDPYILGLSTNVMANNHRHLNEKLAAMGRQSPFPEFDHRFINAVEGYLANLNAGHTGTGQGHQVGTEHFPIEPDLSHVPHRLTRHEADFINAVINNDKAMAQHKRDPGKAAQAQALRELARANGTLITEKGETNRMRHEIEQHEPGWRKRHLEPSIRSFHSGLVHEIHPTEATLPETIRPGPHYQELTKVLHRAIQRGRPDIPIAAGFHRGGLVKELPFDVPVSISAHHNFEHNKHINRIERDFSDGRIDEAGARARLQALGEDPEEYRYVAGSGGLITPYEDAPESITPEEHSQLKDNLRKSWLGGKMDVENYRRKVAEVPLPEIASRKPTAPTEQAETPPEQKSEPAETPTSASQYVSPNVKEGTKISKALKQVQSREHNKARDFYQKVEDAYRPGGGGSVTPTVGNWEGTAEGSSWTHDDKDTLEDARTKAALKGLHSAQKGTAIFHYHEDGPDRHYDIDFPQHSHEEVDKLISKHGFPASTIHQAPEGLRAHLIDPGGENYERALQLASEARAESPTARRGTAVFDGGDDRAGAAENYRRILEKGGIQIRGRQGSLALRGHPSGGQHPLQPLYEEAEDNFARLAPPTPVAPGEKKAPETGEGAIRTAQGPPPAPTGTGKKTKQPPAPGEVLPPAEKPAKQPKTKDQEEAEAEDFRQADIDRKNISPEDAAKLKRIQRLAKAWIKLNPILHGLSMHAYLTGQKKFPGKLKKELIGEHFDATNPKLDYNKEAHRQKAAEAVVHDVMHSLAGTTTGEPSSAYGWYDRTVRKTMAKLGKIAPEILKDPDHELAYKLALAITSQGQDVFPNAESAWHIYNHWRQHYDPSKQNGALPTDRKIFGGGIKAEQMEQNLAKVNELWEKYGTEGLKKILMTRMKSRELKAKYGLDSGEKADYDVNGAMGLGPKIGAFFSNLNGDFDPTTIDLWFSRNMNLMAGNMFDFSDKATRVDRMEKGELVKSHLSDLKDILDSGMVSNLSPERAAKMADELGKLQAHPEGQLDRKTAKELAPEIYNWAREQHKAYQRSYGGKATGEQKGSYHADFKTKENLTAKKLDEGVTGLSDDPRTTTERDNWRNIMERADKMLKDAKVHLTNADKQALLWFNIKDLFKMAGSPQRPKADYLDAAYRLVRKVNSGELPPLAKMRAVA